LSDSRISGLYRQTVAERIGELHRLGWLSAADAELLRQGRHVLSSAAADKIIENVIGVFGLPFAIAPNFIVNGRDYIVPMVVEEPSIVAATSNAARLARNSGGFESASDESLLAGQVHVTGIADVAAAVQALSEARQDLIARANAVHPRLVARGGGVREIEVRQLQLPDSSTVIAVHFLVDTCDAMGANLVNTICEMVAPRLAELCGGDVALRILSNLADRSLVTARVRYRPEDLAAAGFTGEAVRDRVVMASDIASVDIYRATTHNKGIMNGIDAVVIATGNDWRAVEAGAHAFAAATGRYLPLANWSVAANGDLCGEIRLPLKIGIVGGTLAANQAAAIGLRMTGVESSNELAGLMAAVGLAQNFAALFALATHGIQQGHMRLHARSVASAAGVPDESHERVVGELLASGEIKDWKAREILAAAGVSKQNETVPTAAAAGKIILLGEHAVVYGKHALALPIVNAVSASVTKHSAATTLTIPEWGVQQTITAEAPVFGPMIALITRELGIPATGFAIEVCSKLPRAMGLGSSAAVAVALVRAFNDALALGIDNARVNAIAFACEQFAHGTPSGIDNTIATYAVPMLFRNSTSLEQKELTLTESVPLVVAFGHQPGLTRRQVAGVRARHDRQRERYDAIFSEIGALSQAGAEALQRGDYAELGALMNIGHGLLNALEVSTVELESMVSIARAAGASGAKLTGSGGGGAVIALSPGRVDEVTAALEGAGFDTLSLSELGKANSG
jgi:hydroxymethylglutaryl-CoA reductase